MANFTFAHTSELIAKYASGGRPDYYTREKRRTWRTLWLVKRTYRVPHWNGVNISLSVGVDIEERR